MRNRSVVFLRKEIQGERNFICGDREFPGGGKLARRVCSFAYRALFFFPRFNRWTPDSSGKHKSESKKNSNFMNFLSIFFSKYRIIQTLDIKTRVRL